MNNDSIRAIEINELKMNFFGRLKPDLLNLRYLLMYFVNNLTKHLFNY